MAVEPIIQLSVLISGSIVSAYVLIGIFLLFRLRNNPTVALSLPFATITRAIAFLLLVVLTTEQAYDEQTVCILYLYGFFVEILLLLAGSLAQFFRLTTISALVNYQLLFESIPTASPKIANQLNGKPEDNVTSRLSWMDKFFLKHKYTMNPRFLKRLVLCVFAFGMGIPVAVNLGEKVYRETPFADCQDRTVSEIVAIALAFPVYCLVNLFLVLKFARGNYCPTIKTQLRGTAIGWLIFLGLYLLGLALDSITDDETWARALFKNLQIVGFAIPFSLDAIYPIWQCIARNANFVGTATSSSSKDNNNMHSAELGTGDYDSGKNSVEYVVQVDNSINIIRMPSTNALIAADVSIGTVPEDLLMSQILTPFDTAEQQDSTNRQSSTSSSQCRKIWCCLFDWLKKRNSSKGNRALSEIFLSWVNENFPAETYNQVCFVRGFSKAIGNANAFENASTDSSEQNDIKLDIKSALPRFVGAQLCLLWQKFFQTEAYMPISIDSEIGEKLEKRVKTFIDESSDETRSVVDDTELINEFDPIYQQIRTDLKERVVKLFLQSTVYLAYKSTL